MKPRVLCYLGYGCSGSTMLGMALGQHPGIVHLGEITVLATLVPGPTYIAPRTCGCLRVLDQCPYWQGVARRLGSMEKLAQMGASLEPRLGWRHYAPWLPEPTDELERWGQAAADLYRATIDEANAVLAVDTSKGAARIWWLWRSGAVDLAFVWVTRRLEDVIRSQMKRGHSPTKTALSWQLSQHHAGEVARRVEASGARVLRIGFEDLTQQPRAVLSEILEHTGLPWDDSVLNPRPDHVIGGNHLAKHGGRTTIEPVVAGTRPPLPLKARVALGLFGGGRERATSGLGGGRREGARR